MPWGFIIDSNKLKDATKTGEITFDRPEPVENPITWAYDSYAPTANLVGDRRTALSETTSVDPPKHTMAKVTLFGWPTITSIVTSATLTAAGSSFLYDNLGRMRTKKRKHPTLSVFLLFHLITTFVRKKCLHSTKQMWFSRNMAWWSKPTHNKGSSVKSVDTFRIALTKELKLCIIQIDSQDSLGCLFYYHPPTQKNHVNASKICR